MSHFIDATNTLMWSAEDDDAEEWDDPEQGYGKLAICIGDLDYQAVTIVGTRDELVALWMRLGTVINDAAVMTRPQVGPSEFCDYCDLQMVWDDHLGWVDIADGAKTVCEKSPDGNHLCTYAYQHDNS